MRALASVACVNTQIYYRTNRVQALETSTTPIKSAPNSDSMICKSRVFCVRSSWGNNSGLFPPVGHFPLHAHTPNVPHLCRLLPRVLEMVFVATQFIFSLLCAFAVVGSFTESAEIYLGAAGNKAPEPPKDGGTFHVPSSRESDQIDPLPVAPPGVYIHPLGSYPPLDDQMNIVAMSAYPTTSTDTAAMRQAPYTTPYLPRPGAYGPPAPGLQPHVPRNPALPPQMQVPQQMQSRTSLPPAPYSIPGYSSQQHAPPPQQQQQHLMPQQQQQLLSPQQQQQWPPQQSWQQPQSLQPSQHQRAGLQQTQQWDQRQQSQHPQQSPKPQQPQQQWSPQEQQMWQQQQQPGQQPWQAQQYGYPSLGGYSYSPQTQPEFSPTDAEIKAASAVQQLLQHKTGSTGGGVPGAAGLLLSSVRSILSDITEGGAPPSVDNVATLVLQHLPADQQRQIYQQLQQNLGISEQRIQTQSPEIAGMQAPSHSPEFLLATQASDNNATTTNNTNGMINNMVCPPPYCSGARNRQSNPVCGSDGTTYSSKCVLLMEACINPLSNLHIDYAGPCTQTKTRPELYQQQQQRQKRLENEQRQIQLPQDRNSAEGSPGAVTQSLATMGHNVSGISRSETDVITTPPTAAMGLDTKTKKPPVHSRACQLHCPGGGVPVCGSDGETYANACELNAYTCLANKPIYAIHNGPCKNNVHTHDSDTRKPLDVKEQVKESKTDEPYEEDRKSHHTYNSSENPKKTTEEATSSLESDNISNLAENSSMNTKASVEQNVKEVEKATDRKNIISNDGHSNGIKDQNKSITDMEPDKNKTLTSKKNSDDNQEIELLKGDTNDHSNINKIPNSSNSTETTNSETSNTVANGDANLRYRRRNLFPLAP